MYEFELDWNREKGRKKEEERIEVEMIGEEGGERREFNSASAQVIFCSSRYDEVEFTVLYISPCQFQFT